MELIITYTVFSLVFSTGKTLEGPQDAGLNALIFTYSESGVVLMDITFVLFTKEDQDAMQMSDSELKDYAKMTFFGTSRPAEYVVDRTIFGSPSAGEVFSTQIPKPADLEIHFITTESGEKYCIGFKSFKVLPDEIRNSIINEILNSLRLTTH